MNLPTEFGRVAPGAAPAGPAQWAPRVPSAARRAAIGRVGDAAGSAGAAPGDRTRPPRVWSFMNNPGQSPGPPETAPPPPARSTRAWLGETEARPVCGTVRRGD